LTAYRFRRARTIVVLCEGKTEMIAVEHFIRFRWEAEGLRSIALRPINLKGKLEDVFHNVVRFRKDPKAVAVFTLIDLYGMERVLPKKESDLAVNVRTTSNWLRVDGAPPEMKDEFKTRAIRSFYHPHVSVHEVEAWLLADGKCIGPNIEPLPNAEEIDFQNPPKARVKRILRKLRSRDDYREGIDAQIMFKRARFDVVYASCHYFKVFYDDLKQVAQAALDDAVSPER